MGQRALITGAAGFLGGHLISSLLETNAQITAVDVAEPNRELLNGYGKRVNWVQADVVVDDLSEHLAGIDVVYHLAGRTLPGTSEQIFNELCELNVNGTRNVANAAVASGVKNFIHISSAAACGDSDDMVIREETGGPVASYGRSKLKSEQAVKEIASHKMTYVILRPTAFLGENHLGSLYEMVRAIKRKRYVLIGSGRNHMNFLYVKDLVDVMVEAANGPAMANQVFIVADTPITLLQLTDFIKKELGLPPSRFHVPKSAGMTIGFGFDIISRMFHRPMPLSVSRVRNMTLDVCYCADKLKERLSCDFKYGIYSGLVRTIKWYKSQGLI
ncbi:MAG: NAD-dependent epimerase/dehydratase family protein [Sedimentisphaerales bacterium]